MKQLFISDLDGTLLSTDSRVSPKSASIINSLSARGALITVATARTPATVEPLFRGIVTTPPAIVLTGAALWDRQRKAYIDCHFIEADTVDFILRTCRDAKLNPFSYTIGNDNIIYTYYNGTPSNKEQKFIDQRSHLPLKRFRLNDPLALGDKPVPRTILVFSLGNTSAVESAADKLRDSGLCSVSAYPDIFNHRISYLEVFAPGVSKASALRRLKEMTQADRVTVFGDNLNDIPMMKAADVAVAVQNAFPEVRQQADVIIGPNSADSVARYISEQFS